MISPTDLSGLAGLSLAVAGLCGMALTRTGLSRRSSLLVSGLVLVVLLLPFGALPPAGYLRGMVGDLSFTSLALVAHASGLRLGGWAAPHPRRRAGLLVLVVIAAGALYPLALGAGAYDSYRLGYGDPWFLGLLLVLALLAVAWRASLLALAIALAALGWAGGVYESGNLWDYLIDPWLSIYAVLACPASIGALWRKGKSSTPA